MSGALCQRRLRGSFWPITSKTKKVLRDITDPFSLILARLAVSYCISRFLKSLVLGFSERDLMKIEGARPGALFRAFR